MNQTRTAARLAEINLQITEAEARIAQLRASCDVLHGESLSEAVGRLNTANDVRQMLTRYRRTLQTQLVVKERT
jgi:hypothetical protein